MRSPPTLCSARRPTADSKSPHPCRGRAVLPVTSRQPPTGSRFIRRERPAIPPSPGSLRNWAGGRRESSHVAIDAAAGDRRRCPLRGVRGVARRKGLGILGPRLGGGGHRGARVPHWIGGTRQPVRRRGCRYPDGPTVQADPASAVAPADRCGCRCSCGSRRMAPVDEVRLPRSGGAGDCLSDHSRHGARGTVRRAPCRHDCRTVDPASWWIS